MAADGAKRPDLGQGAHRGSIPGDGEADRQGIVGAMATCGTEKNEKIERPGESRERKEARQGRRDLAGGGLVKVLAGGGGSSGEARQ